MWYWENLYTSYIEWKIFLCVQERLGQEVVQAEWCYDQKMGGQVLCVFKWSAEGRFDCQSLPITGKRVPTNHVYHSLTTTDLIVICRLMGGRWPVTFLN